MKDELEIWLSEALNCSSKGRVAIEAFGTPGAGKSYLCKTLYMEVAENVKSLFKPPFARRTCPLAASLDVGL